MEYDNIPDELEDNDIVIYEDIKGNIEIDQYLTKRNAERLKAFLQSIGFNVFYGKDPDSFDVGRPFREGKPFVKKRDGHEVDWNNEAVIVEAIMSNTSSELAVKKLVEISGKIKAEDSKATGFTLDARYRSIDNAFTKWKRENNKVESTENRKDLATEFAKIYCAERKLKRQKRVPIGTDVFIPDQDKTAKVLEYDEKEGYRLETEDGTSWYNRKEFEVV